MCFICLSIPRRAPLSLSLLLSLFIYSLDVASVKRHQDDSFSSSDPRRVLCENKQARKEKNHACDKENAVSEIVNETCRVVHGLVEHERQTAASTVHVVDDKTHTERHGGIILDWTG